MAGKTKEPKGLVKMILDQAGPILEERVAGLKEEAAEEFSQINAKLDKVIKLLENP